MSADTVTTLATGPKEPEDALARTMKEPAPISTRKSVVLGGLAGTLLTTVVAASVFVFVLREPPSSRPPEPVVASAPPPPPSPVTAPSSIPPAEAAPVPSATGPVSTSPTSARPTLRAAAPPLASSVPSIELRPDARAADPITRTRKE